MASDDSKIGFDPLAWMNEEGEASPPSSTTQERPKDDYVSPLGLEVQLLEQSFAMLAPQGERLVQRFYEELFKRHPGVKPLFSNTTVAAQQQKLLAALGFVVQNLRQPEALAQALTDMGKRHQGYGALPEHYPAVVNTLLDVMQELAGSAWNTPLKAAWEKALNTVSDVMISAYENRESATMNTNNMDSSILGKGLMAAAMQGSTTALMMCDTDLTINYCNPAVIKLLKNRQHELQSVFPGFDAENLIGQSIDQFHKNPAHQRALLKDPNRLPYRVEMQLLDIVFDLNATMITDANGTYLGNMVEWNDVTEQKKQELEIARLSSAIEGSNSNLMLCDQDLNITYCNPSVSAFFRERQSDLRKRWPTLDADKLVGRCIDDFHVNPAHQRQLLSDTRNLPYKGIIDLSDIGIIFEVNATAILDHKGGYMGNMVEWKDVTEQKKQELEIARLSSAIEGSNSNLMLCDQDLNITYCNPSVSAFFRERQSDLRKRWSDLDADKLVGRCIDDFHVNPQHQRQLLSDIRNLPYKGIIDLSDIGIIFEVNATAILDHKGGYMGNMVEWKDVTDQMRQQREIDRLTSAIQGANSNLMMCDQDLIITYLNPAVFNFFREREADLSRIWPGFRADNLVGTNIDKFHANPAHQRALLKDVNRLPAIGHINLDQVGIEFEVNATAILDSKGGYMGNMVEWKDVTEQKDAERQINALITGAAQGDLNARIDTSRYDGFMHNLGEGINQLLEAVIEPLREGTRVIKELAEGNLSEKMQGEFEGEFAVLSNAVNDSIDNLYNMVTEILESTSNIGNASSEIAQGNTDLSQRTEEQASSLEETASSMEELTSTVKQNADNSMQANQLSAGAREKAEKGGAVVGKAIDAMAEINSSSKKIADIIGVIDEIAFQTNLLALNAAVEAARAGEQGRGFAVVAGEVRSLAQRSAAAAKEIKSLIQDSVSKVEEGSRLVDESGKTLDEIVSEVKKVSDIIAEISAASQEQASGIDQVNKAVISMDEVTQQNAALVEEAASASEALDEQARNLEDLMQFFELGEHGGRTAARNTRQQSRRAAPPAGRSRSQEEAPKRNNMDSRRMRQKPSPNEDDSEWEEF